MNYVPDEILERSTVKRSSSFGEELELRLLDWVELDPNEQLFSPGAKREEVLLAFVDGGWFAMNGSDPAMAGSLSKQLAGVPGDLTFWIARREYFGGATARMAVRLVIRSRDGDPVVVLLRTAGRERVKSDFLTGRFEAALTEPKGIDKRRARRYVLQMEAMFGDHTQRLIDLATYQFALETEGEFGAVARTVRDRGREELLTGFRDPVREFLTRAEIVGGSDVTGF